ncbi:MAG TPA: cupin domain-containing protein [Geminicoccus sp.]|uniref:cupin domain-containing protein n=1 Tax=Geminicoccus sp. TaxID=2024832 RepID=UPI002D006680|nr:cupin domain-containing protein [Geminicoccus sp.]HWL69701.1 cupin domain-containing protein [Geminicoccus sp.]
MSLRSQPPLFQGPQGFITHMDAGNLPIMRRLSLRFLSLAFGGVREPHWHANAAELGYCIQGEALITIAGNHAQRESFVVAAGQMFFIPSGAMHSIQNIGAGPAEFVLAFSHESPEDFGIKAAFGAMSNAVLGNSYDLPAAAFDGFDASAAGSKIFGSAHPAAVEDQARHVNPYKYSVEATPPQIYSFAGSAHTTKAALWPVLRDIAMFSVRITDRGMREPHWHPETAEMGYVVSGQARMTILDPDGSIDTYVIGPGDAYFIPTAYPHHIENIGSGTVHLLIFFDRTDPGDIGYRSLINVYPRDLLAAAFGMAEADLPDFPFTEIDPLLVPRANPVDPVN